MICPSCGNIIGDREKFCTNCGYKTEEKQPEVQENFGIRETYVVSETPVAPATSEAYETKKPQNASESDKPVSTGTFFALDVIFAMPVLGLFIALILGCGVSGSESVTNFARAKLIETIIISVIVVLAAVGVIVESQKTLEAIQQFLNDLGAY